MTGIITFTQGGILPGVFGPAHLRKAAVTVLVGISLPILAAYYLGIWAAWATSFICILVIVVFSDSVRVKTVRWSQTLKRRGAARPMLYFFIVSGAGALLGFILFGLAWQVGTRLGPSPPPGVPGGNAGNHNPSDTNVTLRFKHTALTLYTESKSCFVANKPVSITAEYENISKAKAGQVSANGLILILRNDKHLQEGEERAWSFFRNRWIDFLPGSLTTELDGGKSDRFTFSTDPISAKQANRLVNERDLAYFMGVIKWTDGAGEHETDICGFYRPLIHSTPENPAVWQNCSTRSHNAIRKPFVLPRRTASINHEVTPIIDLNARTASYVARMVNQGDLPARKLNRFSLANIYKSDVSQEFIDDKFAEFEKQGKNIPFGDNDLGINQVGQVEVGLTGISFQDMLDVQEGRRTLYIFSLVKYKDDRHDVLYSKTCVSYTNGIRLLCGHNEMP